MIVGVCCGLIGTLFHHILGTVAEIFSANTFLIWFLIPIGILVVLSYKFFKVDTKYSTVSIIKAVRNCEKVPFGLSCSIFISTTLTHLFGGSSGREGAALQLGGSLAGMISSVKFFRLGYLSRRALVASGMAGLFAALFGTPLAAAVFVLSIVNVKTIYKAATIPCLVSSYISYFVAGLLHSEAVRYTIPEISLTLIPLSQICLIALLAGFVSIGFCFAIEYTKKFAALIKNEYIRIMVGGAAVLALTLVLGTNDYNGAGANVIERAISGNANPEAFVLKLLFTSITLGFGYKGGEIVPSFFVGSTFGCFVGSLIGLNPSVAAGVGMMAVFCGVTNCPIASMILAAEVFGIETLPIFIPVCLISFAFSGRHSLYGSRRLILKDFMNRFVSAK